MWQPSSKHLATEAGGGVINAVKGFVAWIGGSLAGITAILYVCGYLITTAHIYTLGLSNLIDFDKDYFLLEGAKFLLAIVTGPGTIIVDPLAIIAIAAITPVVTGLILASGPISSRWHRAANWHKHWQQSTWVTALKFGVYGVLLVSSAIIAFKSLHSIFSHLHTSDLLFHVLEPCDKWPRRPHEALMCECNAFFRRDAFNRQLLAAVYLSFLSYLTWRLVGGWRMRTALVTPSIALAAVVVLMLPMDFGALLKPTRYPVVRVELNGKTAQQPIERFLINRDSHGYTLWNPTERRILWIPAGDVTRMETLGIRNLFGDSPLRECRAKGYGT